MAVSCLLEELDQAATRARADIDQQVFVSLKHEMLLLRGEMSHAVRECEPYYLRADKDLLQSYLRLDDELAECRSAPNDYLQKRTLLSSLDRIFSDIRRISNSCQAVVMRIRSLQFERGDQSGKWQEVLDSEIARLKYRKLLLKALFIAILVSAVIAGSQAHEDGPGFGCSIVLAVLLAFALIFSWFKSGTSRENESSLAEIRGRLRKARVDKNVADCHLEDVQSAFVKFGVGVDGALEIVHQLLDSLPKQEAPSDH